MDGKGENSNGQGQVPDLAASLLHQKLQMLELCIQAQRAQRADGRAVRSRPLLGDTFPQSGEDSSEEESSLQRDGATSSASAYHSAGASSVEALDQVASDDQTLSMEGSSNSHTAAQGVSVAWLDRVAAALAGQTLGGAQDGVPPGDDHSTALEPQGVVGQLDATLINDPKRKLNVPATQDAPPCTEDVLIERAAAAQALSCTSQGRSHDGHNGPQGAQGEGINAMPLGTWIRIEGALLLSDMQAFKAANPGCCIEDFVRWHSPKDLIQTSPGGKWELSARMASPDSAWAGLWAAAKPIAADKQRPLFQPALEGERALHFLETLPPAALHAELLGLGFAAAIVFLERAPAARLPSVKAQIERLRRIGEAWLGDGGVAALFPAPVDASEGEDFSDVSAPAASTSTLHDLLAKGLSMQSTQALITALGCVEQTVAAAQSILNRLGCVWDEPEARSLATAPQKMSGDSDVPSLADSRVAAGKNEVKELAERVANALVAAALGQPCTESGSSEGAGPQDYGTFVELSPQEIACLAAAVIKVSGAGDDSGGGPIGAGGKSGAWEPMPFASEWCVEVSSAGNITASKTGEGSFGASVGHPLHRLFVRRLPAELRVATAITGEL